MTLALSIPRDRSRRSTKASEGRITGENGGRHSGAIGHSLVRVEMNLFLAVTEVRLKLLYIEDPGKASREDDVIDDSLKSQGPCCTRHLTFAKLLQEAAQ